MLTEDIKKKLEDKLYTMLKESLSEADFFGGDFMQHEEKESKEDSGNEGKDEHHSQLLKLSDYKDMGNESYGKMKTIIPILTSTYDNDVNTYNLTHSQLSYEMYGDLDPDTARSKFSQKVTGKKRFTAKEINQLFNIISGKIA